MDDYYTIIGVDRSASREEIDRKLREQIRLWQRRTANADLDRRQAAERRVAQLAEARTTLLDEEKRRRYDRELAAHSGLPAPTSPAPGDSTTSDPTRGVPSGPAPTGETPAGPSPTTRVPIGPSGAAGDLPVPAGATSEVNTWHAQARRALAARDYPNAAYAAREALRGLPNPPAELWILLAQANTELGRLGDALFEAERATNAAPKSSEAHLTLAKVREQRMEWLEASQAYEAAARLDPDTDAGPVGMARTLARSGRIASAMDRLERGFQRRPDRAAAGRTLARGLLETAEVVLRPAGGYQAVRSNDLALVQRMLQRAREVTNDSALLRRLSALEQERLHARAANRGRASYGPAAGGPRATYSEIPARTNVLATVALVLAIAGLGTCVTAPAGAVLGHVARNQIRERGERGDQIAIAAVVVGWLVTTLFCCAGFYLYANF